MIEPRSNGEIEGRDFLLAAALAGVFALLYGETFQQRIYGDGAALIRYALAGSNDYHNVLLPWLGRMLHPDPLSPGEPALLARLCSASAGVGLGCSYLVARALAARRGAALLASALLGLSPLLWFFATTIEVHALHFATVAVAAAVTLLAPWRRHPWGALALVCTALPWTYLSHVSAVLLLPGWILLVGYARARVGAPFSGATLAAIGLLLGAVMLLANAWANHLMGHGLEPDLARILTRAITWYRPQSDLLGEMLWGAWLRPHGALALLAVLGLLAGRRPRRASLALVALILPALAFFLLWGVPERGAYFLGSAVFLAALGAGLPRWRARPAALAAALAIIGQGVLARCEINAWDCGSSVPARVALIRAQLPRGGVVYAATAEAPDMVCYQSNIWRRDLATPVLSASHAGTPPRVFARSIAAEIETILAAGAGVVLEMSYRRNENYPRYKTYLDAMERELRQRFAPAEVTDRYWPMLVIGARGSAQEVRSPLGRKEGLR